MKKVMSTLLILLCIIALALPASAVSIKVDTTDYTCWRFGNMMLPSAEGELSHATYKVTPEGFTLNTTGKGSEYWCNVITTVKNVDFDTMRYLNFKVKTGCGTDFWNIKINKDGVFYDYAVAQADLGDEAWRGVPGDREGALKIPDDWTGTGTVEIHLTGLYFMDVSESVTFVDLEFSDTERPLSVPTTQGPATNVTNAPTEASQTSPATDPDQGGNTMTKASSFEVEDVITSSTTKTAGFVEKPEGIFSVGWFLAGVGTGMVVGVGATLGVMAILKKMKGVKKDA